jgi:hypothetical protein
MTIGVVPLSPGVAGIQKNLEAPVTIRGPRDKLLELRLLTR